MSQDQKPTNPPVPPGFYKHVVQVPTMLPMGCEIKGEVVAIMPLSNGSVSITIPSGGIPHGMHMLCEGLRALAEQQSRENIQVNKMLKERESRIIKPTDLQAIPPNIMHKA